MSLTFLAGPMRKVTERDGIGDDDVESVFGRFNTLEHRTFGYCVMDDNWGLVCTCQSMRAANHIAHCLHLSEETARRDERAAS